MNLSDWEALQRPHFPPLSWLEVLAAIRALDGGRHSLFTFVSPSEPFAGYLMVQGYSKAYSVTAYLSGRGQFRYFDPNRENNEEVLLCNCHELQDFVEERYVCAELECVLGLAWHFWEYGQLHPACHWEQT